MENYEESVVAGEELEQCLLWLIACEIMGTANEESG